MTTNDTNKENDTMPIGRDNYDPAYSAGIKADASKLPEGSPAQAKPVGRFFDVYREELHRAVAAHPDEYAFREPLVIHGNLGVTTLAPTTVDGVADKMIEAMKRRSFSKEGRACKATCKRLGIKHTYTAIYAHLEAEAAATGP